MTKKNNDITKKGWGTAIGKKILSRITTMEMIKRNKYRLHLRTKWKEKFIHLAKKVKKMSYVGLR